MAFTHLVRATTVLIDCHRRHCSTTGVLPGKRAISLSLRTRGSVFRALESGYDRPWEVRLKSIPGWPYSLLNY